MEITHDNYLKALDIVKEYLKQFKEEKPLPRYIIDIRSGCGAVLDTWDFDYDETYPGLHYDTSGVVEYRHGYKNPEKNCWDMKEEDIDYLSNRLEYLNNECEKDLLHSILKRKIQVNKDEIGYFHHFVDSKNCWL